MRSQQRMQPVTIYSMLLTRTMYRVDVKSRDFTGGNCLRSSFFHLDYIHKFLMRALYECSVLS